MLARVCIVFVFLFLSACGGDGSIVVDRNTLTDLFYHPRDAHVAKVHFQNGDTLSSKECVMRDGVTACFQDKQPVIKDESCKGCSMNIVVLPLACKGTDGEKYECKLRSTRRDPNYEVVICTIERMDASFIVKTDCPVSYE